MLGKNYEINGGKMKEATLHNFQEEILNSTAPCVVKFTNDGCHLCVGLKPVFDRLEEKYTEMKFFNVDTLLQEKLTEIFSNDGVPTIYMFYKGGASEIPYPDSPDEETGYSEKYLNEYLNDFLGEA